MKQLKVTTEYTVAAAPEKIFGLLSDFSTYNYWFPKTVSVRVHQLMDEKIGSIVQLKPMEKLHFSWTLKDLEENTRIEIEYSDGVLTGPAVWLLRKSKQKTILTCSVELQVRSFYFRLLPAFAGIEKLHRAYMDEIVNGIEDSLRQSKKK